jgi:hypothetical protein
VCVHLEEPGAGRLKLPPYLCLQPHTGLMRNTCWEGLISPGTVESLLSGYLLICYLTYPKPKKKKTKWGWTGEHHGCLMCAYVLYTCAP